MPGTKIDRRVAANKNDELIAQAAKRTDWAGAALERAAGGLHDARGRAGDPLTDLEGVVLDEAARVSHLAEDIESQRVDSEGR